MATSGNKRRIPKDITNRGNPNKRKVPRRKGSVNGPVKSGIISPISKPYKPPGLPKHIAGREAGDWKRKARAFVKGALVGLGTAPLAGPRIRRAVREAAEEAADEFVKGRRKKPPTK